MGGAWFGLEQEIGVHGGEGGLRKRTGSNTFFFFGPKVGTVHWTLLDLHTRQGVISSLRVEGVSGIATFFGATYANNFAERRRKKKEQGGREKTKVRVSLIRRLLKQSDKKKRADEPDLRGEQHIEPREIDKPMV